MYASHVRKIELRVPIAGELLTLCSRPISQRCFLDIPICWTYTEAAFDGNACTLVVVGTRLGLMALTNRVDGESLSSD